MGINFGARSINNIARRIYFHDCGDAGNPKFIMMAEKEVGYVRPTGCIFEQCHIVSDHGQSVIIDEGENTIWRNNWIYVTAGNAYVYDVEKGATGCKFYHNTIIHGGNWYTVIVGDDTTSSIYVRNNIIKTCGGGAEFISVTAAVGGIGFIADNNDYFDVGGPGWRWLGAFQATMALWRTASGVDAASFDADPLFNTEYTNLHLQAGSTCRNAGMNVLADVPTDYDGIARDAAPDVGAYEYV